MRGVRPARSNILTELSTQDETITQHIQHINGQLGLLIDQLGKLEGLEQTRQAVEAANSQSQGAENKRRNWRGGTPTGRSKKRWNRS